MRSAVPVPRQWGIKRRKVYLVTEEVCLVLPPVQPRNREDPPVTLMIYVATSGGRGKALSIAIGLMLMLFVSKCSFNNSTTLVLCEEG